MKKHIDRMSFKFGYREDSYVVYDCRGLALPFLLAEAFFAFGILPTSEEYVEGFKALEDFCKMANDETGYRVSIWWGD